MFRTATFDLVDEAELAGAARPRIADSGIGPLLSIGGSTRVFRWVAKSWDARIVTVRELETPGNRLRPKNPLDSKPTSV